MKYKIYAGLGGSFGGATYVDTLEFENEEHASEYAYEVAIDEYEKYEGFHGLKTYNDCIAEAEKYVLEGDFASNDIYVNKLEECAREIYNEEMERWIDYYVEEDIDEE